MKIIVNGINGYTGLISVRFNFLRFILMMTVIDRIHQFDTSNPSLEIEDTLLVIIQSRGK